MSITLLEDGSTHKMDGRDVLSTPQHLWTRVHLPRGSFWTSHFFHFRIWRHAYITLYFWTPFSLPQQCVTSYTITTVCDVYENVVQQYQTAASSR